EKIHTVLYRGRYSQEKIVVNLETIHPSFIKLFEGIYEQRNYYKAIIQSKFKYEFLEAIHKKMINFGNDHLRYEYPSGKPPLDIEIYINYTMSAIVGVILYWIQNDFKQSPSEIAMRINVLRQYIPIQVIFE
ncbi:TetR-like C-terminal domain-containing protein, partial [Bacillus sp. JJ722]|uniref:TetR-like C-terminal domain-containing protein n=1 Tax=Bacillus sp. JJ722 TaxID=3122973 RepID=UPI002FFE884D